jgi:hypothetical protein
VRRVAYVEHRIDPNTWGEYQLFARMFEPPRQKGDPEETLPDKPFKPVEWRWDFGDGSTAVTSVGVVHHSYEGRAQESLFSQFLASVEIVADDGRKIVGRGGLALHNPAWESFAFKGAVLLMTAANPRFPERAPDGVVRQKVRVWHIHKDPVTITKVTVIHYYNGAVAEAPPNVVDAQATLGTNVIPPGAGIEVPLALDTVADPDTFQVGYWLEGRTPDGYPASGMFAVMRPPANPTKDRNDGLVRDPMLQAKILAARKILGKEFVSEEDLIQLERQGRFDGLQPDPDWTPPPASSTPSAPEQPKARPPSLASSAPPKDLGPPPGYKAPATPGGVGSTPIPPRVDAKPPKVTWGNGK